MGRLASQNLTKILSSATDEFEVIRDGQGGASDRGRGGWPQCHLEGRESYGPRPLSLYVLLALRLVLAQVERCLSCSRAD